jgi:ABC-type enterobactin transport system permease subunit
LISIKSRYSSIVGGQCNLLSCYSYRSSIIGGCCNTITGTSSNSVILGGNSLTLTGQCNTALTQHLWIAGSVSPNNGSNFGQTQDVFVSGFGTFSFINGVLTGIAV